MIAVFWTGTGNDSDGAPDVGDNTTADDGNDVVVDDGEDAVGAASEGDIVEEVFVWVEDGIFWEFCLILEVLFWIIFEATVFDVIVFLVEIRAAKIAPQSIKINKMSKNKSRL